MSYYIRLNLKKYDDHWAPVYVPKPMQPYIVYRYNTHISTPYSDPFTRHIPLPVLLFCKATALHWAFHISQETIDPVLGGDVAIYKSTLGFGRSRDMEDKLSTANRVQI
mgnify:CR=1 FL=1